MKTHEIETLTSERPWLARLAARMVRDQDDAEDVAQEALVAALTSPPPADRPVRGWLGRVATNVVRGRHRSATRRERREQVVTAEAEAARDTFAEMQRHQAAEHLARALDELAEPFQTAVRLRFFDDLPVAEVAMRTGVPAGTAGWRIHEGVKRLRASLDAQAGGDARSWLMALCPLPSFSASTSVPHEGGTSMSTWIGIGIGAAVIAAGTVATVVAASDSPRAAAAPVEARATEDATSIAREAPRGSTAAPPTAARPSTQHASTTASPDPSWLPTGAELTLVKREGPGGDVPAAIYQDMREYGAVLFQCFEAHGLAQQAAATLRITLVQDADAGAIVADSEYVPARSSVDDPEFAECFRSGGLAIKLDQPIGPAGTRYVIDMTARRHRGGDFDPAAVKACFDDLARRRPGVAAQGKIDDAELARCMERVMPPSELAQLSELPDGPPSETESGVAACVSELQRRRPGIVLAGTVDDATFRDCMTRVLGPNAANTLVFHD